MNSSCIAYVLVEGRAKLVLYIEPVVNVLVGYLGLLVTLNLFLPTLLYSPVLLFIPTVTLSVLITELLPVTKEESSHLNSK